LSVGEQALPDSSTQKQCSAALLSVTPLVQFGRCCRVIRRQHKHTTPTATPFQTWTSVDAVLQHWANVVEEFLLEDTAPHDQHDVPLHTVVKQASCKSSDLLTDSRGRYSDTQKRIKKEQQLLVLQEVVVAAVMTVHKTTGVMHIWPCWAGK